MALPAPFDTILRFTRRLISSLRFMTILLLGVRRVGSFVPHTPSSDRTGLNGTSFFRSGERICCARQGVGRRAGAESLCPGPRNFFRETLREKRRIAVRHADVTAWTQSPI